MEDNKENWYLQDDLEKSEREEKESVGIASQGKLLRTVKFCINIFSK